MVVIDIIFIGLIALFVIRCYLKGFISEVLSMAAIVLGLLSALFFHQNVGAFFRTQFGMEMPVVPEVIGFIALLVVVFIIIKLLEMLLKSIIEGVRLGKLDRLLGILFGLAEGIVVVSLILFLLKIIPFFDETSLLSDSFFAKILLPLITGTITGNGGVDSV